jgi:glycosyltransferase involved in cell wall biosynthesis
MNSIPTVSILMPIRNEAAFLSRSLAAVLAQDYPVDQFEVIVADGMSTDDSPQIVASLAAQHSNLRLIRNPKQIVPTGLNAAWAQARGEIIVRVDGHCEISRDYVRHCVEHLQHKEIDGVGGPLETVAETSVGEAIAFAMQSPFGVGGAVFRTTTSKTMLTDTVAFPAYKRAIMEQADPG